MGPSSAGCLVRKVCGPLFGSCLIALLTMTCASPPRVGDPAQLVLVDTVVLGETDSAYVGRPGGLYIDSGERIYVPDLLSDRVLRFDSLGRLERVIGRSGSGPGEFRGVGEVLLEWNGLVAIQSYGHRRIDFFETDSGRPVGEIPYSGTLTSGTLADARAWFGDLDFKAGFGVMALDLRTIRQRDLPEPAVPLSSSISPLPAAYRNSEAVRGTYGMVQVVAWPDSLLVGYAAESTLVVHRWDGAALDTIFVPSIRRRGIPRDFSARMSLRRSSFGEIVAMASALFGVWRRPAGDFVLVHMDSNLEGKRTISSKAFVSLLTADRRRVCVDAPLPIAGEAQPKVGLRGEALVVLDQYAVGPRITTVVRRFRIDPRTCTWLATHRGERR